MPNGHDDDSGLPSTAATSASQGGAGAGATTSQFVTEDALVRALDAMQARTSAAMEAMFRRFQPPEPRTTRSQTRRGAGQNPANPANPEIRTFFGGQGALFQDPPPPGVPLLQNPPPLPQVRPQQQQQPLQDPQQPAQQPQELPQLTEDKTSEDEEDLYYGPVVPSASNAFTDFHSHIQDAIRSSQFCAARDQHEMAALRDYGYVWKHLPAESRRQIWSRLQLYDLVARYGWGQALRLHPGATSQYSLPIEPAALALTSTGQRGRPAPWGPPQDGGFQRTGQQRGPPQPKQWRPTQPQQQQPQQPPRQ